MNNRRGAAFTLVEIIIVIMIIGIMCGGIAVCAAGKPDGDSIVRLEADEAAIWLTDRMARAQVEECNFKIWMSECNTKNAEIRLTWQDGTLNGKTELYESTKARIFPITGDLARTHLYNGEWNTLTPALTLNVKPMPPLKAKTLYIVMSGLGHVSVRDNVD